MFNINKKAAKSLISSLIVISILAIISVFAFNNRLTLRTYYIVSDKINDRSEIRIVLLADLHSTLFGEDQRPLLDIIESQEPDIIILAGDIIVDPVPDRATRLFLAGIQDLAPIYYVTGNHEYWGPNAQNILDIFNTIQSYGITILSDTYEKIQINGNTLIMAGVEDPDKVFSTPEYDQLESIRRAFHNISDYEYYKILISHRPENLSLFSEQSFDLVLSGHTHGGQFRIPFLLNGLYAPDQGWFPDFSGGMYTYDELTLIISRGLATNHPRLPRIFNPPEVVTIVLTFAESFH
jgi:predicted MPP superfamily phosphohydrolase